MASTMRLWSRDIQGDVNDLKGVPDTLSSWDNCMSKNYCKWPVIVGIIIGSIIVLSIIWCLARCLCCGLSCCCDCMSCCGMCCPNGRNSRGRHRHLDNEAGPPPGPPQAPFGQYNNGYRPPPQPSAYEPPRFAQFDVPSSRKNAPMHEDSLPAMPSWDSAQHRQIAAENEHKTDAMEMGELDAAASQRVPMLGAELGDHSTPPGGAYHDAAGGGHGYGYPAQSPSPGNAYSGAGYAQPGLAYPPQSQQQQQRQPSYGSPRYGSPGPSPGLNPGAPNYTAYTPYHSQQQETGVAPHTPNSLTPGRPQQDSWTIV